MDEKINTTFAHESTEMEAVFRKGLELERQGKLDADATRRIEEQLQAIWDRQAKKIADSIAEIKVPHPTNPPVTLWRKIAAAILLFSMVSMLLEFTIGENFVFSYANTYRAAMPLLFVFLLPVFANLWFHVERKHRTLACRYPTWWVRWLVMIPLLVIFSSALVIFSPFGWSALAGWAIGTQSAEKTAKVLSIGEMHVPRRIGKCDQKAALDIDEIHASICIEDRIIGAAPKVGDTVTVVGKRSLLGFYIDEIHVESAQ